MPEDTPPPANEPVEPTPSTNAPDSDAQHEPAQPMFPQVSVNLDAEGLHVFMMPAPMNVDINEEVMDALTEQWIDARPALFEKIVRKRVEQVQAAQQRLHLVTDPKTVRKINKSKQGLQA